ncbi:hypothetical protein Veis_3635 [Verminephrobacter eiseniae EF01-2]|uniref:Uncharacterized protein n=1 Tax=Verminephrobacter eiseniae (strain EF01-2) TaxID=391735 RepID=A1WNZ4_VEREI|nr:hypothetical protein Veis_3635 [Verminephrobacter eiseniae EF01-2]
MDEWRGVSGGGCHGSESMGAIVPCRVRAGLPCAGPALCHCRATAQSIRPTARSSHQGTPDAVPATAGGRSSSGTRRRRSLALRLSLVIQRPLVPGALGVSSRQAPCGGMARWRS